MSDGFESQTHRSNTALSRKQWLLFALILLPWLSILTSHYLGNGEQATGFIQYDQPYYVANGRAAFERGNGLLYPNPSDASAHAPVIYFHWLPWILGGLVSQFGFEPGVVCSVVTAALLPVFGWLTWRLICRRIDRDRMAMFFLAMWGGGVLSLLGILKGTLTGKPLTESVFEFDPTEGLWFLSWGRNSIYAVEITYHCLVAASWLCVMQKRKGLALVCAGVLAATHPWSGLELLLMLNAWFLAEAVRQRSRQNLLHLGTALLLLSLLLGYYEIWLPGFPEHAALQANWEINWRAEWSTIVYAYGPVAAIAVIWLKSRSFRLTRDEQFLLVIVAVSFGLTIHDRFVSKPIQPLHFSRGYTWMPLFLVAAPQLQKLFDAVRRVDHRTRWLIWSTGICLAVFDNVAFSLTHSYWQFNASGQEGFLLTRDDRAVLESLRTADNPVVFCESLDLSYLMPTYVPTRPWLCHEFNTPDYIIRQQLLRPALAGNSFNPALIPSEIDVVVLKASRSSDVLQQSPDWQPLQTSGKTWQVWTRSKWP